MKQDVLDNLQKVYHVLSVAKLDLAESEIRRDAAIFILDFISNLKKDIDDERSSTDSGNTDARDTCTDGKETAGSEG